MAGSIYRIAHTHDRAFLMKHVLQRMLGQNLGNTLWMMSDKVLRIFGGLVVGVLVARHLGPVGFGQLSLALTALGFFAVFSTLGMDPIAVKHFATLNGKSEKADTFKTLLALRLLGGMTGYATLLAIIWLASPWDATTHVLASIVGLSLVFQAADTVDLWFQAHAAVRKSVLAKSSAYLAAIIWRIAMVVVDAPIQYFAFATVIEGILAAALLGSLFATNKEIRLAGQFHSSVAKEFFAQSWPLIGAAIAISVYNRTDQIVLAKFVNVEAVGLYTAAIRISEAWYFIPVTLVATAAPMIARTYEQSRDDAILSLEHLFRRLILIGIAVAIPLTLMSPWLIEAMFGTAYQQAATALSIHVWAGIFVSLGVAQGPWFVNEELTRLALYRAIVGAIASILLNILLIPVFGIVGGAISILFVQFIANVALNAVFPSARSVFAAQCRALMIWRPIRNFQGPLQ